MNTKIAKDEKIENLICSNSTFNNLKISNTFAIPIVNYQDINIFPIQEAGSMVYNLGNHNTYISNGFIWYWLAYI